MNRARFAALAVAALLPLGLTACSAPTPEAPAASPGNTVAPAEAGSLLATHGLEGKSGREIVEALDQEAAARPLPLMGSVRYGEVLLSDGTTEEVVPIEGDEFYLSIAPYASQTHECFYHSLATCMGEMQAAPVHVKIVDSAGKVLVDEDATTYANGFVGFWLPKDISGEVTVTADGKTGTVPFATGKDDATCLTTLKVA